MVVILAYRFFLFWFWSPFSILCTFHSCNRWNNQFRSCMTMATISIKSAHFSKCIGHFCVSSGLSMFCVRRYMEVDRSFVEWSLIYSSQNRTTLSHKYLDTMPVYSSESYKVPFGRLIKKFFFWHIRSAVFWQKIYEFQKVSQIKLYAIMHVYRRVLWDEFS